MLAFELKIQDLQQELIKIELQIKFSLQQQPKSLWKIRVTKLI